jgi:hypothetical protein
MQMFSRTLTENHLKHQNAEEQKDLYYAQRH